MSPLRGSKRQALAVPQGAHAPRSPGSVSAPGEGLHDVNLVAGPTGARELPVEEFFISPKANVRKENVLAPNEIVTHVTMGPGNPKSATYEVRQRESTDWPICLASVLLELEASGAVKEARICLGAVAPVPWRVKGAEAALKGKAVTAEAAQAAADAAVAGAAPLAQNAYKVKTAHTAVKRAILLAATGKWS